MKKVLLLLLVVVVAGLGFVYVRLGSIVKDALESYGPKMLGAPVRVGVVTLSPFSGKGTVRSLRIGNPEGFSKEDAISLDALRLSLEPMSLLRGDRVVIHELAFDKPALTVETGSGGTNLQKLQKNLESYSPSSGKEAEKTESRKVEIGRLTVKGGKVTAKVPQLNTKPYETALPDLELTGIGTKSGGATAAQAAHEILSALTQAAVRSAGGKEALIEKGTELIKGLLKR